MAIRASASKKMMMVKNQEENTIVVNFPDDIIEMIMSFLPLKKAYSSGLPSKRFSDSWKLSRDLSFDIDYRTLSSGSDIFNLIQFVLNEHRGPVIGKLKFILDPTGKENQVCDWIRKAIAKGLQELDVDFSAGNLRFSFPPDVLHDACLEVLKVCYCELDSLKQWNGWRYLKTLTVEDVYVPRFLLDAIFSKCLFLENLEITNSYSEHYLVIPASKLNNFKSLKVVRCRYLLNMFIDAPLLQVFHFIGEICRIVCSQEMSKMEDVVLQFNPSRTINLFPGVIDLMMAFRETKTLSISSPILERICGRYLGLKYSECFGSLRNLKEIRVSLGGPTGNIHIQSTTLNPYDIANFLSKSPSIEKLTIDFGVFPLESGLYWEIVAKHEFDNLVTSFNSLNTIYFMNFKFFKLEMQLASFIIASAPVLRHCFIVKAKRYPGSKKDQLEFVHSLPAGKFKTTVYEHNQYK